MLVLRTVSCRQNAFILVNSMSGFPITRNCKTLFIRFNLFPIGEKLSPVAFQIYSRLVSNYGYLPQDIEV